EDNPYDILENNLYKTNILLSEPLRSVGDVKDRLFRDSDGLWKVEQNGGEMIVDDTTNVAVYPNYNTTTHTSFQVRIPSDRGTKTVEVISSHFESTRSGWNKSEDSVSVSTAGGITNIWIQCEKTFASKVSELISKNVTLQWELQAPTTETLPEELQTELNNIASFSKGNYVYTLQPDKSEILSPEVLEELTPTLHATFKGGGWYNRWKTEQDLIKQQEDIDNKTDQEVTDEIQDKIDEMESIKADNEDIDLINDMIEEYGKLLENESERVDLATGEIVELMNRVPILENNLGEFSERWTFLETAITMGEEGLLIGNTEADTGIRIGTDRIDFVDKGEIVAYISNQTLYIERGIFVKSLTVGEHKDETIAGGHTVTSWVGG